MPKTKKQVFRHKIIDAELRARPWVKTTELRRIMEEKLMEPVDVRTIQKDIKAMAEDTRLACYAPIEYNNKKKAFRYTDRNYSIFQFGLQTHEINALKFYASCLHLYSSYSLFKDFSNAVHKIINGITLKNALKNDTNPDLIIQTDTTANVPGVEWLGILVQAIDEKSNVSFPYRKYTDGRNIKTRVVSPVLLKEYRSRWHMLGLELSAGKIKTFALDRMGEVHLAPGNYINDDFFNAENYFKHSFGITTPDEPVREIILEVYGMEMQYVRSLPVRPAQQILKLTKNSLAISIKVIPSFELYEFLFVKSPNLKVISPEDIKERIKAMLQQARKHLDPHCS